MSMSQALSLMVGAVFGFAVVLLGMPWLFKFLDWYFDYVRYF